MNKLFNSSFHYELNLGVQKAYFRHLEGFREEINKSSPHSEESFFKDIKASLNSRLLDQFGPINFYWLDQVDKWAYFNQVFNELKETQLENEGTKELQEEIFDIWNGTDFAYILNQDLEQGLGLLESSEKLKTIIEEQILSFFKLHIDSLEDKKKVSYIPVSEMGDYSNRIYHGGDFKFISFSENISLTDPIELQLNSENGKLNSILVQGELKKLEENSSFEVSCPESEKLLLIPTCPLGNKGLDQFKERVELGLKIIKHSSPKSYETFLSFTHYLFPINEPGIVSYSQQYLPGFSYINMFERDFIDLMDDLIHENGHHYLNHFLNQEELINEDDDHIYFSPWRRSLRPIRGLYHATFTFFWAYLLFSDLSLDLENNPFLDSFASTNKEKGKIYFRFVEEGLYLDFCRPLLEDAFRSGKINPKGKELIDHIYEEIDSKRVSFEQTKKLLAEKFPDRFTDIEELVHNLQAVKNKYYT